FGHEKGAFTDAKERKQGLFELADGGTIFLDEIGELVPELQPKLLKVLDTKTFRRLGGTRELAVNVRLIAATNRDLASDREAGRAGVGVEGAASGVTARSRSRTWNDSRSSGRSSSTVATARAPRWSSGFRGRP